MQYAMVGIATIAIGFVLGYWAKTLKNWNEVELVNLERSKPKLDIKNKDKAVDMLARINDLEARNKSLEAKNDELEKYQAKVKQRNVKKHFNDFLKSCDSKALVTVKVTRDGKTGFLKCICDKSEIEKLIHKDFARNGYLSFNMVFSKVQEYITTYFGENYVKNYTDNFYWKNDLVNPASISSELTDGAIDWKTKNIVIQERDFVSLTVDRLLINS
ncbi:hypothetical protein [Lactobacillus taiwanensis]|uniref:hypothetical protein n=1 Tax=Lactobacillus taiwanensis TaxID=508451 RepID=UPI0025B25461|nr:hypothetical protein [Lactobacillus taiwanensis]